MLVKDARWRNAGASEADATTMRLAAFQRLNHEGLLRLAKDDLASDAQFDELDRLAFCAYAGHWGWWSHPETLLETIERLQAAGDVSGLAGPEASAQASVDRGVAWLELAPRGFVISAMHPAGVEE